MRPEEHVPPVEVFCSYSHKDRELRARLDKHLEDLKAEGLVRVWHDGEISPGAEWEPEIFAHLKSADVILLLITLDFLMSNYVLRKEIPVAMERARAEAARVVPIILKPVGGLNRFPFGKLQCLPRDGKAVTTWLEPDAAFEDIADGLRAVILRTEPPPPPLPPPDYRPLLPYLCDRSEQETTLKSALHQHQASSSRRPFICVVHGDELECHGDFVERVQETAIKQILKLGNKGFRLLPMFEWPRPAVPQSRYVEIFRRQLGLQVLNGTSASVEDIVKKEIAPNDQPLILTSTVHTKNFGKSPAELVNAFLQFWHEWPDLPPGRTVIHFVCIKHVRLDLVPWIERWRMRKISAKLRHCITSPDLFTSINVHGVVLEELQAIQRGHVEDWSRHPAVRKVRRIADGEIRALFQRLGLNDQHDIIPMERLAGELKALLQSTG